MSKYNEMEEIFDINVKRKKELQLAKKEYFKSKYGINKKYTSETILKFGLHKGKKLCNIPNEYFIDFYKNNKHKNGYNKLIEYIEENNLCKSSSYKNQIDFRFGGIRGQLICKESDKVIFPSEKDAKFELKRIVNTPSNNKKPVRTYECEKCSGWHLTSISFEEYKLKSLGKV